MGRLNSSFVRKSREICLSLLLGLFFSYVLTPYLENDCSTSVIDDNLFNFDDSDEHIHSGTSESNDKLKEPKTKKLPLVRPRYFSSELGIKEKLFVAVLTREKTVRTLAIAINKTSTHLVDKILFFIDAKEAESADVLSLKLQGIVGFIDTKQILKPFHTIKYLFENFIEDYEYFFIMTDRTYLNARLLLKILNKISVSEELHVGGLQAGDDSNFCSLDGGILLSNSIIKKMGSSLDWCVKNAYSDSDSDNLGRCILHASRMPCKLTIWGRQFEGILLPQIDQMNYVKNTALTAITYSPVTDENVIYLLHYQLTKKELVDLKKNLEHERRGKTKWDNDVEPWPLGSYPPTQAATRFDLLRWTYFDLKNLYFPNSQVNIQPLQGADFQDVQNVVEKSASWIIAKYKGELSFSRLVNGYRRFDPGRGLDYILDLAFTLPASHEETIKRVECSKPLGRVEVLPLPYVTESARVVILLPVRRDSAERAIEFMKAYSQIFMAASELTHLLIVFLYDPKSPGKGHSQDVFKEVKEVAEDLTFKHRKDYTKIAWLSIKVPEVKSFGVPVYDDFLYFAMVDLAMKKMGQESLILFTDPYVDLKIDFINRVRMNTVLGKLVFSPMPFMEYDPEIVNLAASGNSNANTGASPKQNGKELEIHKNTGHFNPHNYKHISFYSNDFLNARKLSGLPIVKNDRDILSLYANHKLTTLAELFVVFGEDVAVLRAPEPALRVRFGCVGKHTCSKAGTSESRCHDEMIFAMATRAQLADALLALNTSFQTPT